MGRKLILSVLPFCVRLQWGPTAHLAFASFLHLIIDSLCVCFCWRCQHILCLYFLLCLYVLLITYFRPSKGNVMHSFFKGLEIFTADLSLRNAGIVSSCCLHICMDLNDVPHFVYGVCNEEKHTK